MPTTACKADSSTLFFVEGDMERAAFKETFGISARRIGLNGQNVALKAIAENISTDLMFKRGITRVFILFDREGRKESTSDISGELTRIMKKKFPKIEFMVAIPDRDIECWLFSDREVCSRHFKKKIGKDFKFEGYCGTDRLKMSIGAGYYKKMSDGVKLFGKVRWEIIQRHSESAREAKISEFFPRCAWLNPAQI